jgi:hypothetical protein
VTLLEKALKAVADLAEANGVSPRETLAALKAVLDDVDKRIWDIKEATGIGLWKE